MSTIKIGDWVWYKGSQGAANAEGAILSRRGRLTALTGITAQVRWWDSENGLRPPETVDRANLVPVCDVVPQGEPARVPKPPTLHAPHAL
jgi:hypothetical protein